MRKIGLRNPISKILNLQSPIYFDNHGGRKRQVGLGAIVYEIIIKLRGSLKSPHKSISFNT